MTSRNGAALGTVNGRRFGLFDCAAEPEARTEPVGVQDPNQIRRGPSWPCPTTITHDSRMHYSIPRFGMQLDGLQGEGMSLSSLGPGRASTHFFHAPPCAPLAIPLESGLPLPVWQSGSPSASQPARRSRRSNAPQAYRCTLHSALSSCYTTLLSTNPPILLQSTISPSPATRFGGCRLPLLFLDRPTDRPTTLLSPIHAAGGQPFDSPIL